MTSLLKLDFREFFGRVYVRTTLILICVLLVFSSIVVSVQYAHRTQQAQNWLANRAQELAQVTAGGVSAYLASGNKSALNDILFNVGNQRNVVGVWTLNADGEPAGQVGPALTGESLLPQMASVAAVGTAAFVYAEEHLTRIEPVRIGGKLSGAVAVQVNKAQVQEAAIASIVNGVLVFMLALLLTLPLSIFLIYRSSRGISQVTEAANEAASGFLTTDFPITSSGEVGALQTAFRAMIGNLRGNIRQIEAMANRDSITGIPNRINFTNIATKAIEVAPNSNGACLFVDLTRFQAINETHGHAVGDSLLVVAARRLMESVDNVSVDYGIRSPHVACFSDNKFTVLLPGITDRRYLEMIGELLIGNLSKPYRLDHLELNIGATVGIAIYPENGTTAEEIFRNADMAMYAADDSGKQPVHIFDYAIQLASVERDRIERDLRGAIRDEELSVYYQPKIDLKSGQIVGAEALLRWNHPELGFVPPDRFIPIAEECGLISPIGELVLTRSMADMMQLHSRGQDLSVAVNVAPIQFQAKDFASRLTKLLQESPFPKNRIELEITETTVMDDPVLALEQIQPIKDLGVRLALDDFGTGYSSLNNLASLPFDTLKIDRSFMRDIIEDENRRAILRLILMMASQLDIETVAEGVETPLQLELLQTWGAEFAQGYHWSPPIPLADFTRLVQTFKAQPAEDLAHKNQWPRLA